MKTVVTPLVLRVIGAVVTVLWVISVVVDAINPAYDPPDTIGLAFMAMLSAVLGAAAVGGRDKREDEPPPPPPPPPPPIQEADDE
jgi:hypothetical protein